MIYNIKVKLWNPWNGTNREKGYFTAGLFQYHIEGIREIPFELGLSIVNFVTGINPSLMKGKTLEMSVKLD